jgi:asparagine synthetase B (glutamine-hydrolysing)
MMSETHPDTSAAIDLIRSTPEILRWNYPGLQSVRSMDSSLFLAEAADPEVRSRNKSRSLFDALVESISTQLSDQPCYVELSGGCDSSLVLSAATSACHQANHEPPQSVTFRFPDIPSMDESGYQNAALQFLHLKPGHVFEITDEFDLLGPSAQQGLLRFGPVCPAPLFSQVDVLRTLTPGLLLSGEGGDEVLGPRRISGFVRAAEAAKGGHPRALASHLVDTIGPASFRHRRFRQKKQSQPIDWIEVGEVDRFLSENSQWSLDEPLLPGKFPAHYRRSQTARWCEHQLSAVRRWSGHQFYAPLMDPNVVQAVADLTPAHQTRHRRMVLNYHFSSNLPRSIVNRTSKVMFQPAYFNRYSKEFARSWSGQIDDPLVNGHRLQMYLLQEDVNDIHNLVFLLLQQAWLNETTISSRRAEG